MTTLGAFAAKTNFNALLRRVARGETIQITRRGIPVARLVPITTEEPRNPRDLAREIRRLRRGVTLGKLSIRELIRKGRRH